MASKRNRKGSGEFNFLPKGFYESLIEITLRQFWRPENTTKKIFCKLCQATPFSVHVDEHDAKKKCHDHLRDRHCNGWSDITTDSGSSSGGNDDSKGPLPLQSDFWPGAINHGVRSGHRRSSPPTAIKQPNDPHLLDQGPFRKENRSNISSGASSYNSVEASKKAAAEVKLSLRADDDIPRSYSPPNIIAEVPSFDDVNGSPSPHNSTAEVSCYDDANRSPPPAYVDLSSYDDVKRSPSPPNIAVLSLNEATPNAEAPLNIGVSNIEVQTERKTIAIDFQPDTPPRCSTEVTVNGAAAAVIESNSPSDGAVAVDCAVGVSDRGRDIGDFDTPGDHGGAACGTDVRDGRNGAVSGTEAPRNRGVAVGGTDALGEAVGGTDVTGSRGGDVGGFDARGRNGGAVDGTESADNHGGAVGGTDARGGRGEAFSGTDSRGGRSEAIGGIDEAAALLQALDPAMPPPVFPDRNTENRRLLSFQNPNSNAVRALAATGFHQPDTGNPREIRCYWCDGGFGNYDQITIPLYRTCRNAHQPWCPIKSSFENDISLRALFPGGEP